MALQGIKMTVPAGDPGVAAPPVAAAAGGGVVVIDPTLSEQEREEEGAVLGEDDLADEDFSDEDYFSDDDDDDEYVDSDSEFDDDDGQPPPPEDVVGHGAAAAASNAVSVGAVGFLGRLTRFATAHSTAAFMRLAAAEAAPPRERGGDGEILVHYRYTRFFQAQGGGDDDGVEAHALGPKQARVRFHLPSHAADPASSLQLAGAAVAPLLYPARFSAHLRDLWSCLVAMAPVGALPRGRTRLVVAVDAGILRPRDGTPARMRSMVAAMESLAREREAQPAAFDVGAELRLPAPLVSEDDVRPAKRRKVAGEDCPICCEALDQDLAAWPRCSHIFHARCLGEHLVRGSQECPMCRSGLEVDAPSRD